MHLGGRTWRPPATLRCLHIYSCTNTPEPLRRAWKDETRDHGPVATAQGARSMKEQTVCLSMTQPGFEESETIPQPPKYAKYWPYSGFGGFFSSYFGGLGGCPKHSGGIGCPNRSTPETLNPKPLLNPEPLQSVRSNNPKPLTLTPKPYGPTNLGPARVHAVGAIRVAVVLNASCLWGSGCRLLLKIDVKLGMFPLIRIVLNSSLNRGY